MKAIFIFLLSFVSLTISAQSEQVVTITRDSFKIEGTLLIPDINSKMPVVIIIAGSGPTDRNGNNPFMVNNSLKMIAESLLENNIASLRFDKRGIGKSATTSLNESELRFEDYINDVVSWIDFLKKDKRFNQLIVLGHSEGSLIGMIAAQHRQIDKFISVAGSGEKIDVTLKKQLKEQPAFVLEQSTPIIDSLAQGHLVKNVPPFLNSLFRPSVQPYMISWMKYNPQDEITRLEIPVLIIQGTTDLQVSVNDAKLLKEANPNANLFIIEGMNHILKNAEADRMKNLSTYNNQELPLNIDFVNKVTDLIKN